MMATPRQMEALKLRISPLGYGEVGKLMGVGRERAHQLALSAVKWLMQVPDHPDYWMVEKWRSIKMIRRSREAIAEERRQWHAELKRMDPTWPKAYP